jgi:hypothetical protein
MTPQEIVFMSEAYWRITGDHPEFVDYFAVSSECYFVAADGTAYHFRLGTEDDIIPRPETADTSPTPTPMTGHAPDKPQPTSPTPQSNPTGLCGGAIAWMCLIVFAIWRRH